MGLVLIGVIEEYKRYPKGEGEKRVQKGGGVRVVSRECYTPRTKPKIPDSEIHCFC